MTATPLEQLRNFHITGVGPEGEVPMELLESLAPGGALPSEDAFYPICIAADYSVQPGGKQWRVAFDPDAAVVLPAAALLHQRRPIREKFAARVRQTAGRLEDLLSVEASLAEEGTPGALSAALGQGAMHFVNPAALAEALGRRGNPIHRMDPARRDRCSRALQILRKTAEEASKAPPLFVFHGGPTPPNPFGGELHQSPDPCADALAFSRAQLAAAEVNWRALRVARLELESAYDPTVHDAILERFRWDASDESEVAALPPVMAVVPPSQVGQSPLDSFSRLLRSGQPIFIVIPRPALTTDEIQSGTADLAALAIAYRSAPVLQSSLARPDHLLANLGTMARALRPALAVIATPSAGGWAESAILVQSRAWALYAFDPSASRQWRECFQVPDTDTNGWTLAHAAALNPMLAGHFRLLPELADEGGVVELGQYLAQFRERAALVPYLATQMRDGAVRRIAISRDLAEYCQDRLRAFDLVQQWAAPSGVREADQAALSSTREQAVREGAGLAISQVVAMLNDLTERR